MIDWRRPRRASLKVVGIVALVIMGPWVTYSHWADIGRLTGWW
jgi:hypothetical protein